jgi:hypothetical protein
MHSRKAIRPIQMESGKLSLPILPDRDVPVNFSLQTYRWLGTLTLAEMFPLREYSRGRSDETGEFERSGCTIMEVQMSDLSSSCNSAHD